MVQALTTQVEEDKLQREKKMNPRNILRKVNLPNQLRFPKDKNIKVRQVPLVPDFSEDCQGLCNLHQDITYVCQASFISPT